MVRRWRGLLCGAWVLGYIMIDAITIRCYCGTTLNFIIITCRVAKFQIFIEIYNGHCWDGPDLGEMGYYGWDRAVSFG